jgi:ubiquilin
MRNNPMLANMIRNPEMRRMLFNPEMIRMQLQMQQAMGGADGSGTSFPAPGVTDTTPQPPNADGTPATPAAAGGAPSQADQAAFANLFAGGGGAGGGAGAANPFANLFGPGGANPFAPPLPQNQTQAPGANANTPSSNPTSPPPANPFGAFGGADFQALEQQIMQNPDAMRMASQLMAGGMPGAPRAPPVGSGAANPFAALFGPGGGFGGAGGFGGGAGGFGAPAAPADTRPPEEVYESQLRQLNEMGFFEFERNVSALRRSGGNVQGAIEYLLNGA